MRHVHGDFSFTGAAQLAAICLELYVVDATITMDLVNATALGTDFSPTGGSYLRVRAGVAIALVPGC
jgi:hypothetical protein